MLGAVAASLSKPWRRRLLLWHPHGLAQLPPLGIDPANVHITAGGVITYTNIEDAFQGCASVLQRVGPKVW